MKTTIPTITAALLAALACNAQEPPKGPPPLPLLEVLDKDADRKISAEEIKSSPESIRELDADGDGTVSKEELRPKPPGGEPGGGEELDDRRKARPLRRPVPPVMAALDEDRDGELSTAEIDGAPDALLELDQNDDGEIDGGELHPPRGKREKGAGKEEPEQGGPQGPPPGGGRPPGPPGRGGPPPRGR